MEIITLMPTRGTILTEVQDALDKELAHNNQVPVIVRTHDLPLPISRNYLIETALKIPDWTHALLIDDDVILPEGGLKELIKLNCDVAVMDYPMRGTSENKSFGTAVYDKDKSLAWAGLGAVLVKREVFEKIPQPWFVLTQYRIARDKDGRIGFFASQKDNGEYQLSAGEDTYFYLQCRKHNLKVKVTKKTATHCFVEQTISPVANGRYQNQHKITKRTKVEGQFI